MITRVLLSIGVAAFLLTPRVLLAQGDDDPPTALVLCYHIVESPLDPRMEISRETFRQQMRYLAMTGYNVIPLRDLYDYVSGRKATIPHNAVVITIDDGWRSTYTEVFPEMKRRHFPFTVFVYPRIIGQTSYAMTWKQVKEMSDAGVDIQSHSLSHPYLTRRRHPALDDKAYEAWIDRELVESKKILEHETGKSIEFIAYPYGDYDRRLTNAVLRAGYTAGLTCDYGPVRKGSDPLRMRRFAIDKRMDFSEYRHLLGAGQMQIANMTPTPGQVLEPSPALTVSAKIPNHSTLDPKSVGIALMSAGASSPYSYDPNDGLISVTVKEALKGKLQRALVWATDRKSGKRVEATWTFRLPDPAAAPVDPAQCPAKDPLPAQLAAPALAPAAGGVAAPHGAGANHY
jgi:peptidoglycan/xylan/chitin deacetylase (PgdA/CDA1 family)